MNPVSIAAPSPDLPWGSLAGVGEGVFFTMLLIVVVGVSVLIAMSILVLIFGGTIIGYEAVQDWWDREIKEPWERKPRPDSERVFGRRPDKNKHRRKQGWEKEENK